MQGIVKVILQRGFGFITQQDGLDIYFHVSAVQPRAKFDELRPGDTVEFQVVDGQRGREARPVVVV